MALCVDTKLALIKQGCFVQMTKGPGLFPRSHNHPGVEWILIHSGGARISTEGWTTTALPGSIVVIPGKLEHSTCPISQPFSRTVIHAADELCVMENFTDADDQRHSVELSADAFDRCFWAARQLYALTTPQKQPLTKVLHKLVDLIYAEFESAQNNEPNLYGDNNGILPVVICYMNEHLESPESLSELANRFNVSERHLCRLFGSQLGYSPQRYWLNLRLERACQLLSMQVPVTKIASQVGFESVRGFQRAFRRSFGIPPSHYLC
jgi:AraC-like DNA-binding protein